MQDCFAQTGYRVRLAWGRRGASAAAARGDVLVVVDTLSFSTAVATAVARGATVWPCRDAAEAATLAAAHDAEAAVPRRDAPARGRFSLSPVSMAGAGPGTRIVLPSLNGATCTSCAPSVPRLLVGALVNAAAVTDALRANEGPITVLACGERWREDGAIRFALEDYLGAGAILEGLGDGLSPEAEVCAAAFRAARPRLPHVMRECGSGRELREIGFAEDVERAAALGSLAVAPELKDGRFSA